MTREESLKKAYIACMADTASRTASYLNAGIDPNIVNTINVKRSELLRTCKTMTEIKKLMESPKPYYNGCEFIPAPGSFDIPEEEAVLWSFASLKAPLNAEATKRYLTIMKECFGFDPEEEE